MKTETVEKAKQPLREITKDGRLVLHLHPGQLRAWDSKKRFVFILAGSQSGKTSFLPHWLHREMTEVLAKKADPAEGVGDYIAATSTYDLFKLKMLPEIRMVFEEILGIGRYWAGERIMELSEGLVPGGRFWAGKQDDRMYGRIILRSAEAPSGLEAATAEAAVMDEVGQPEFPLAAFEAILRRLSLSQGRVLGMTSLYNMGWLKQEVYDKWAARDPNFEVIQFDSTENPNFPMEEFERARNSMPVWKFNMLYRGLYAKPTGLVYDCFDDTTCIIDRFPIPANWLLHFGHDFGSANPAALMFAQDPGTGLLYVVKEFLPGAKPVADQVEEFKEASRGRIVLRRMGGSHQEKDSRENYAAHGWPIAEPPIKSVEVGISRVYAFHKRNALMVFRDCKNYINEKLSYSYELGDNYSVTDEIADKSRYHLLDAERYALCGLRADGAVSTGPRQVYSNRF